MNPLSRDAARPDRLGDDRIQEIWRLLSGYARQFSTGFWLVVIIPCALTAFYLFFIASDLYMSEARFIVRSPGRQSSGVSSILQSVGMGSGAGGQQDESFAVESFITSRDAVHDLDKNNDLRAVFSRPEADYLTRFPNIFTGDSFEALYRHYGYAIDVSRDNTTGVTTLQVLAYRPQDSQAITRALLFYSEQLVNKLNKRAEQDAISQALDQIEDAERNLIAVQKKLTDFRVEQKILDPKLASTSIYELLSGAMSARITTATQIAEMTKNSPNNPAIPGLRARLAALDAQIAGINRQVTGSDPGSVAGKLGGYERLSLNEQMAEKVLATATEALETARVDARRQHLYIEHIAEPSLSDYPLYPRRLLWFAFVLATTLIVYGIGWLLVAGVREHTAA